MSTATSRSSPHSPWLSVVYAVGMLGVLLGERLLGAGTGRLVLSGAGAALVVLALVLRGARLSRAPAEWKAPERWLLALYAVGAVGLGLYFAQSDLASGLWGGALSQQAPRAAVVLVALFPALVASALLPVGLVELALGSMAQSPLPELGRLRTALYSGLGLSFTLVFVFSSMYVATQADHTWDLSYFRTARPGDASKKLVRGLNEPLEVTLFFPPANDVGQQVEQYFRELEKESPQLRIQLLDQAVEPARARELGVSNNGTFVLSREGRREMYTVPLELDRARGQLQRLDQEVYQRLRQVARPRQVLYFTSGHGERALTRANPDMPGQRAPISDLAELLRTQNIEVRSLSLADGLGVEVPKDATMVAVVGPTKDFLPEELNTLREYAERGGRLWLALEPDGPALEPLLQALGVKLLKVPLANDQVFFRITRQQSDRANLGSNGFSSHPAVTTLSQLGQQVAVAFLGAAALEPTMPPPNGLSADVSVRAHEATFQDANGNFNPDPGEQRNSWPLVVAVEKQPAGEGKQGLRAVVMGDAEALTDGVLGNPGNAYLAVDTVRWLSGEEALAGAVTTEEDVPIQHTREQDVVWFYSSVFLAPALVLGAGFFVTRRRGRRTASAKQGGAA